MSPMRRHSCVNLPQLSHWKPRQCHWFNLHTEHTIAYSTTGLFRSNIVWLQVTLHGFTTFTMVNFIANQYCSFDFLIAQATDIRGFHNYIWVYTGTLVTGISSSNSSSDSSGSCTFSPCRPPSYMETNLPPRSFTPSTAKSYKSSK
jgi:hypothetical protein